MSDKLKLPPDSMPTGERAKALASEIRQDEKAARVRDGLEPPDEPTGFQYKSSPESIENAREVMREVKDALTPNAEGALIYNADLWEGMNLWKPEAAWQKMDAGERYDILLHAVNESIWSLDTGVDASGWRDSQKLALEFVKRDDPAAYERFTREWEAQSEQTPAQRNNAEIADMMSDIANPPSFEAKPDYEQTIKQAMRPAPAREEKNYER